MTEQTVNGGGNSEPTSKPSSPRYAGAIPKSILKRMLKPSGRKVSPDAIAQLDIELQQYVVQIGTLCANAQRDHRIISADDIKQGVHLAHLKYFTGKYGTSIATIRTMSENLGHVSELLEAEHNGT